MKASLWKSLWTALLLAMTAVMAHADTGYAYALIPNGASPLVAGSFSLNPNAPPTATRNGAGFYTVTFAGFPGSSSQAMMAASFSSSTYCNVTPSAEGAATEVFCYGSGGVAADSGFTVLALSGINDKGIGFAFANQPKEASYSPVASASYNPSGAPIVITRSATGTYQIVFDNLSDGAGGTVQVNAVSSNAICNSAGWTSSSSSSQTFTANVNCFDPTGAPFDSQFLIAVVPGGATPTGLAYALVDSPSSASYTLDSSASYNPTGRTVSFARSSTGAYQMTFAGLNAAQLTAGGDVRVTANNSQARCIAAKWTPDAGSSWSVVVTCSDLSGNPVDSQFEVLVLPAIGYAYAVFQSPAATEANSWVNPGGPQVTSVRNAAGSYTVTFPNSGIDTGWGVMAQSIGTDGNWCKVSTWAKGVVNADCFDSTGGLIDEPFLVWAVSNTNQQGISFALASQPTMANYNLASTYSFNAPGTISVTRTGTGAYSVTFAGLNGPGGAFQVSAVGGGAIFCASTSFAATGLSVVVECFDQTGAPVDAEFEVAVVPTESTPLDVAYTSAPPISSVFFYNPAGPIAETAQTSSIEWTFKGLAPQVLNGGLAVVTSTTMNPCETVSWPGSSPPDFSVDVTCPANHIMGKGYDILVFAPIVGLPDVVSPSKTSSPQTAVATTAFATSLTAVVTDDFNDPISGIPLTFTAPATGASGTFPGGVLTVTVTTDSNGNATAPAFTANSTSGAYTVLASFQGASKPASFTLTNALPTSVTLQTSPPGLMVSLDSGGFVPAPLTVDLVPGFTHTIATQSPQTAPGAMYVWQSWSDSQAITHTITVPSSNITYTATFQAQYQLTISASPTTGGGVTPSTGSFYNSGTNVSISATPNPGFTFAGWSGPAANPPSASTTVAVNAPTTVTAIFTSGPASNPTITSVSNAEGASNTIAPNTWVAVKGAGLAPVGDSRIWLASDFVSNALPTALDGVSVTVNGKPAFVYYISPAQINILTPPDAMPANPLVVVTNNGVASAGFTAQALPISPSFFVFNGGPYVIALHLNGNPDWSHELIPGLLDSRVAWRNCGHFRERIRPNFYAGD
jgi:Divergent InlB B-repeat domain